MPTAQPDWTWYLESFHRSQPGITEDILARSKWSGITPYEWLRELVPSASLTLDLGCGSAPLFGGDWQGLWVGTDRSPAELELAKNRTGGRLMRADATRLPFAAESFGTISCSMALMLLEPFSECMTEISRTLLPGGRLVALLPGGPAGLSGRDVGRWARLLFSLRVPRLRYPNDVALRRPLQFLDFDLTLVAEEHQRFAFTFDDEAATERFVDSLYLPDLGPSHIKAAKRVTLRWIGHELGIPLRRLHFKKR